VKFVEWNNVAEYVHRYVAYCIYYHTHSRL